MYKGNANFELTPDVLSAPRPSPWWSCSSSCCILAMSRDASSISSPTLNGELPMSAICLLPATCSRGSYTSLVGSTSPFLPPARRLLQAARRMSCPTLPRTLELGSGTLALLSMLCAAAASVQDRPYAAIPTMGCITGKSRICDLHRYLHWQYITRVQVIT